MSRILLRDSYTTTGIKAAILAAGNNTPYQAVLQVTVGTSATYDVEFTCDGINWLKHPDGLNQTASGVFTFAYPITATRLNIAAVTGTVSIGFLEG